MAELVGVDESTISNYERGISWDAGTVSLILEVLGASADALEGQPPPLSDFAEKVIDQEILAEFSDDVLSAIMFVGVWLTRFEGHAERFVEERRRLTKYMLEREKQ